MLSGEGLHMLRHRAAWRALSAQAGGSLPPAVDVTPLHAAVTVQPPVQPHEPATLSPAARSFYKRQLPRELIPFASQEVCAPLRWQSAVALVSC